MHRTHPFEHEWTQPSGAPAPDPTCVDVAVLDMNYGMPNLGHDALIGHLETIVHGLAAELDAARLRVRAISYDVRRELQLPEHDGQFRLYIGTGGPGHLDPRQNDGQQAWAQGVDEQSAAWERPLFALFDAIHADRDAAMIGICHSFGLLCRWSGIAEPAVRGPEKGGKSAGIVGNVLCDAALEHPWFQKLSSASPDGQRVTVTDSRLFDLLPTGRVPEGMTVLAKEEAGEAVTMAEFARSPDGTPRMIAVNSHPEIINPALLSSIMREKLAAGDVDEAWVDERQSILDRQFADRPAEAALEATSEAVLFGPLRTQLSGLVRERAATARATVPAPVYVVRQRAPLDDAAQAA